MTRKHYKAIARALRETRPEHNNERMIQWNRCVLHMCAEVRAFNPAFDRERFLSACGYEPA